MGFFDFLTQPIDGTINDPGGLGMNLAPKGQGINALTPGQIMGLSGKHGQNPHGVMKSSVPSLNLFQSFLSQQDNQDMKDLQDILDVLSILGYGGFGGGEMGGSEILMG